MDKAKRVVLSFLNSAERYFHTKTVLQENIKQPRDLYGPVSNRPERWNYTDIRDVCSKDIENILGYAQTVLDKKLFALIPSTAINAALQTAINTFDNSRFQSKIDGNMYNLMYGVLLKKLNGDK